MNLGALNLYAFGCLVKALVEDDIIIKAEVIDDLKKIKEEYEAASIPDRGEIVRHCQLEKQFRPDLKRLVIALKHPLAHRVFEGLVATGAEKKRGKAPMGYLERDLQEWIEAME